MSPSLFWVLLGYARRSWVLIGITGYHWTLLGITGYYWVLMGFPIFFLVRLKLRWDWFLSYKLKYVGAHHILLDNHDEGFIQLHRGFAYMKLVVSNLQAAPFHGFDTSFTEYGIVSPGSVAGGRTRGRTGPLRAVPDGRRGRARRVPSSPSRWWRTSGVAPASPPLWGVERRPRTPLDRTCWSEPVPCQTKAHRPLFSSFATFWSTAFIGYYWLFADFDRISLTVFVLTAASRGFPRYFILNWIVMGHIWFDHAS